MRFPRLLSRGVVITASAVVAVGAAGAVVAATHVSSSGSTATTAHGGTVTAAASTVTLVGLKSGHVPWNKPVQILVDNGHLRSVAVTESGNLIVDGVLSSGDTVWTSSKTLVPLTRYVANVSYADSNGHAQSATFNFSAADTSRHLKVTLSPGDSNVVGIGSPVIATFSRSVPESKRAAVEARLSVLTAPEAVVGAWHWMSSQEVHWRPPTYWKSGTHVTVSADLSGLYLGGGVWGAGNHTTSFRIGASHISRVDVARHQMYVYDNGHLVRTFPISAGRDKYPTKNGVHITFEKSQVVTMDSATVGIPRNSPDGYYEKVYWDVRISYGGAFVHAAPWSVGDQGRVNVSHGCVNISTANAEWFYNWSTRGDIVDVYNSTAAPNTADPGMADWNMSWAQWVAGDAAPSASALATHTQLPRDYEPAAPPYHATTFSNPSPTQHSTTSSPSPSPSRKPSPSPSPTHH
ncbi:MAG TPA: Ig-like domain-containing protein [Mycobacteriales bacterium]|nr:Ig-like domain-containing protein [Mycobacteriales bacterium]